MNIKKIFVLSAAVTALTVGVNAYAAKDIQINSNNTPYTSEDIQKLAATAVSMGVKEPVNLNLSGSSLNISGSNATQCTFKVGSGNTPKIQGISCK